MKLLQMVQCTSESCGLRAPVLAHEVPESCPLCQSSIEKSGEPFRDHKMGDVPLSEPSHHIELCMDNLRSAYNVGSLFRTSDGVGVKHIHLCGITPTPNNHKVAKTALDTEQTLPWTYYKNGLDAVRQLKAAGYEIWALELTPNSESLWETPVPDKRVLLIVGSEVAGVDPAMLPMCDKVVSLPMMGVKQSLNVATATGIALYQMQFGRPI